ncbi:MAG: metallophosphoesterase [Clostridia bacterium]|nr:metallophosphoesterase [Clostridia bacterium]
MTRLGIVSDSHDRESWLACWLERCKREKYDAVFHLGDYHSDARWLERRLEMPVIAVAGNCDMFSQQPRMALWSCGRHRLLAVHGHLQDVKYGYDRLSYFAEEQGANIALFGHTHRPCVEMSGSVLLINPGALMDGCYAELVLDGDRAVPYLKSLRDGDA